MNNFAIHSVINQGLQLMQTSLNDLQYQAWLEYSKATLSSVSNNPSIMINYMRVVLSASAPGLQPYQRLSMCLKYLIDIQTIL